ncbi:hypothetical protein LSPH24S_09042 [Lysinibacillus sphaericus]
MAKGIFGSKIGMTQVFAENGDLIPVTVIEATPNVVLQKKTVETDGYEAIQVGFEDKRVKLSNKPAQGHVAKANTAPKRFIREFRNVNVEEYEVGQEVKVEIFAEGDVIDVTGVTKGKGLQGVIKRHGQSVVAWPTVLVTTVVLVQWVQLLRTAYLNKRNYLVKWVAQ